MDTLQYQIIERVRYFINLANKQYPHLNITMPEIRFDIAGCVAGRVYYSKHLIRFNLDLCTVYPETFLNDVVPHEVSHLVTNKLFPTNFYRAGKKVIRTTAPHGPEWQSVMRNFGVDPKRCHTMDVSVVTSTKKNYKRYHYKCNCSVHVVGPKIHHNIQKQLRRYTCRKCNSSLTPNSLV